MPQNSNGIDWMSLLLTARGDYQWVKVKIEELKLYAHEKHPQTYARKMASLKSQLEIRRKIYSTIFKSRPSQWWKKAR